jgi:protein-S-isoprenylcysteine O-methyltransferase Ste14
MTRLSLIKRDEEPLVAARYPEYAQYKARTWRMIPYVY